MMIGMKTMKNKKEITRNINLKEEYISSAAALKYLEEHGHKVCIATLLHWAKKYKLGYQLVPRGPWRIEQKKLIDFVFCYVDETNTKENKKENKNDTV